MISSFEQVKLSELLKDFYTVVGIRISVFDDDFSLVTEYPQEPPEICALIRSSPAGRAACARCDKEACMRAKKKSAAHSYVCHAGITEAITPIQLAGGVVGYAILAHIMPTVRYEETVGEVCERCLRYGLDPVAVEQNVRKLRSFSSQTISASMRLLDAVASYLQISKMANWKNENIVFRINEFIEYNLANDLSSDILCSHFFVSRTKLYQIAMHAFGMGIGAYIMKKRIERAAELLKSTERTVSQIAREVGIPDGNYFSKLFKREMGLPPAKYRLFSRG